MTPAGYIVVVDWNILGYGNSPEEAEQNFMANLKVSEFELVDDETDMREVEFGPTYILREDVEVRAATEALIKEAKEGNFSVMWTQRSGVACLPAEAGLHFDKKDSVL